ncbi:lipoate--protein ligase family protein [Halorussus caseinilyticus]|uniref:lipoate--protein ligase family protein n=1 Tax=Halorussus caseinilyticus TaxID=3034025 RepID=UPI0023E8D072|nr:biotin/lipoate A/B protein ligase family protein [Halorussus sp. DT72]
MALSDREWRLIREESRPGQLNMALDEIAAETAANGGPRTVRVYQWDPSTLSLGYRQATDTVAWDYCDREGITVTRRPTGGGGIYHDRHGDISYSIVAPAEELPGDLMDTYELLCEPVFDAFDRLGIDARFTDEKLPEIHQPACYLRELHPAHDVVAGADGRKISGNAQYRRKDAIIQHGSLKFDADAERHLATFADPETTPEEFRERVTTMREQSGASRGEAVEAVEEALGEWADAGEGSWTDEELRRARERAEEKFESGAWVREREDPTE